MALARNPYIVEAIKQADYDVVLMVTAGFTIKIPIVKSKTAYGAGFNCLRKPF